jgi:hypothetical protein
MTPPKRALGVTLTAVVSILGSALILVLAAFMVLAAFLAPRTPGAPQHLAVIVAVEAVVFALIAAWGVTTAVGLFRLREWARCSTIAFSALLLMCTAPGALVMAFVQLPEPAGTAPGIMSIMRIVMICFYALLALLSGMWLWYFNTAALRVHFGAGIRTDDSRPVSISIIAWFMIIGGAAAVIGVIFAYPVLLFGLVVQGGASRAIFLLFGAWELWAGLGLLKLRPRSRIAAIAFFSFAIVNGLAVALIPGLEGRLWFAMQYFPSWWPGRDQMGTVLPVMRPAMVAGVLITLLPIWFLIARRSAFGLKKIPVQQAL